MSTLARSRRPTTMFVAAALTVFAIELALVRSSAFAARPGTLAPAVAFDLAVFVPALYWLIVMRRGGGSWLAFLGVLTLCWAAAPFVLPPGQRGTLRALLVLGPIAEAASLGLAAARVRRIARAYRAWTGDPADVLVRLRAALVAIMGGSPLWKALSDELSMWRYAFAPPAAAPAGPGSFTYHRRSAWGAVVLALALAGVAETIGLHVLVAHWSGRLAWLLSFTSVYTLVWLVADVRACARRPIRLDPDGLLVRVGIRWTVRVPWHALATIERVSGSAPAPARRAPGYLRATALGSPSLLLQLREELVADGPYGIRRPVTRLGLAPDDPSAFRAALEERLAPFSRIERP